MPRARTKAELLSFAETSFAILMDHIASLTPEQAVSIDVFPGRNTRDILAHVLDWHTLMRGWLDTAAAGDKPATPAPGYKWNQIPALNEALYQGSRELSFGDVIARLRDSHTDMLTRIASFPADDLEQPRRYPWTGSTTLASYFASCTSSHYVWANDLLRAFRKRIA